jgi:AcrR family transcriptional regulator
MPPAVRARSSASSNTDAPHAAPPADETRRRRLLDASMATFARYGFRKTSMDEVARTAGISRQGLYLHFTTKEALFQATVQHVLDTGMSAATRRLNQANDDVADRLLGAFDEWLGRFVGAFGADVTDIGEASTQLVGTLIPDREAQFGDAIAKVLRTSGVAAAYKPAGLSARQLADTLYATARGLKHHCRTRGEFVERMRVAVRAMCMVAN